MPNPPSLRTKRPIASRRKKCAGAAAVIAAGAEGAGAGVAGTGAAAGGVAGIGAGIAAVVGAAATGAAVATGKSSPGLFEQGIQQGIKKAPRERGFCRALEISISAAASIAPHGAVGAAAAGAYYHDRRHHTRHHHYGPA